MKLAGVTRASFAPNAVIADPGTGEALSAPNYLRNSNLEPKGALGLQIIAKTRIRFTR
jgi:hypothetical protein